MSVEGDEAKREGGGEGEDEGGCLGGGDINQLNINIFNHNRSN